MRKICDERAPPIIRSTVILDSNEIEDPRLPKKKKNDALEEQISLICIMNTEGEGF